MKIREAEFKDIDAIVAIYDQAFQAEQKAGDLDRLVVDEKENWFHNHDSKQFPIYVAEEDGEVVGWLCFDPYRAGRQALRFTAELSYYIDSNHQRKGIGSLLMEHAIDNSPYLGFKTIFSIICENNEGSIHLLKKFGFEQWGNMPRVVSLDGLEVGHLYYGMRVAP